MGANLSIDFYDDEKETLGAFLEGIKDRLSGPSARDQILPILKKHLQPLVDSERAYLEPHNKSGALSGSLSVRSGAGDFSNTVSVFSTPTATNSMLAQTWGLKGRAQQKGWFTRLKPTKGRKRVFYGAIVHQGHGNAAPVPFADQAAEALGEQESEAAGREILDLIM